MRENRDEYLPIHDVIRGGGYLPDATFSVAKLKMKQRPEIHYSPVRRVLSVWMVPLVVQRLGKVKIYVDPSGIWMLESPSLQQIEHIGRGTAIAGAIHENRFSDVLLSLDGWTSVSMACYAKAGALVLVGSVRYNPTLTVLHSNSTKMCHIGNELAGCENAKTTRDELK